MTTTVEPTVTLTLPEIADCVTGIRHSNRMLAQLEPHSTRWTHHETMIRNLGRILSTQALGEPIDGLNRTDAITIADRVSDALDNGGEGLFWHRGLLG